MNLSIKPDQLSIFWTKLTARARSAPGKLAPEKLAPGKLANVTAFMTGQVGQASLSRTAMITFGLQGVLLVLLSLGSITSVWSALGDVAKLNGVVHQQRLLLDARIAVVEAGDKVKTYALTSSPANEATARRVVVYAAKAVDRASGTALNRSQKIALARANTVAAQAPPAFDDLVVAQKQISNLVRSKIYMEGAEIQERLSRLSMSADEAGEEAARRKANAASAAYSMVRLSMERFLSDPTKQNIQAAKDHSLALEDILNQLYTSTKNAQLLAQADGVIGSLISYDEAFQAVVKLTAHRKHDLDLLLDRQARVVGGAVDLVGGAVDSIQDDAARNARLKLGGLFTLSLAISMAGILFVILASVVFRRAVTEPILKIADDMQKVADGELTHRPAFTERADEIGEMARSLEIFRTNAIEVRRLQSEEAERLEAKMRADQLARDIERRAAEEKERSKEEAEQTKRAMLVQLATQFENHVSSAMETVSAAAREIEESAHKVAETVASSQMVAATVTDAAVEASASTSTIAAATEEMSLSLAEVSHQVVESSKFAIRAVDQVGQTDEIVTSLARDAAEIGEVVSLVHNIAQQVNLLALNATIEASRAGEAGRGFAVVAAEVKSLAQQTANATARISERVSSIQNVSQTAMQAINEIGAVISEMGVLSTSVATAVEQQVSTTAEIARNTTLAAAGTNQVTNHLKRVQEGVSISGNAADAARTAAEQVSRQTEALRKEIEVFLTSVRAA